MKRIKLDINIIFVTNDQDNTWFETVGSRIQILAYF